MHDVDLPRGVAIYGGESTAVVHFDGACQRFGDEPIATYGFTLEGVGEMVEGSGLAVAPGAPHATNNVAEYVAAICGLERLQNEGFHGRVILRGDSQLVIRQMTGEYRVETEHLRAYHDRLEQLVRQFALVRFEWVPREENAQADLLSKQALDREAHRRSRAKSESAARGS